MKYDRSLPFVGVLSAIAITTAMDASGLSAFSALPLCPLMLVFSYLQRFGRVELGLNLGRWGDYGIAILHPVSVPGMVAVVAAMTGALNISNGSGRKVLLNVLVVLFSTWLITIVTEEGFFRGWLWASLRRAGRGRTQTLALTSIAFALWHLSAVLLPTGFNPPMSQVPVFMINALLLGIIWGMLREISASVIVAGLGHALWNAITYVLFGFGSKTGYLGIAETALYGPEVGILGIVFNMALAAILWHKFFRKHAASAAAQ